MPDEYELTDEELCLLEQLCYLNADVAEAAGAEGYSGISGRDAGLSVGEILEVFDGQSLDSLRDMGSEEVGGSCVSGVEWAEILSCVKESRIREMTVRDALPGEDGISLAVTYGYPGQKDSAVVAFKGTTGDGEWVDNIEGMHLSDTAAQQEALRYIEEQPFSRITVTGHSKGANKAMYVSVLSGRVAHCAAFDGQGFSGEFIEKYSAEIRERAGIISNYSIDTDFVHILLFPVPGSRQIYCRGFGIDNIKQHHSSNSFFRTDAGGKMLTDAAGRPLFVTEENGAPVPEDASLAGLHRFTAYLLNNASDPEKDRIIGYLAALVPLARAKCDTGEKREAILRLTGENTEAAGDLLAMLARYAQQYGCGTAEIDGLLRALGMDTLDETAGVSISSEALQRAGLLPVGERIAAAYGLDPEGPHAGLSTLITLLLGRLTNGKRDPDIQVLLAYLDMALAAGMGVSLHLAAIWQTAEQKIGRISGENGAGDRQAGECRIRDFSGETWARITESMQRADSIRDCSAAHWQSFAGEPWFADIRAGALMQAIETYTAAVSESDRISRKEAESIFQEVYGIDRRQAEELRQAAGNVRKIRDVLEGISD